MRDLERELSALVVEWPPTPDLAAAIRPQLEPQARRRFALPRWQIALTGLAILLGGVAAVEPARSAVLEFLGLKSVKIERREPVATPQPPGTGLQLGRQVTQAQAEKLVHGFTPRPPAALGTPGAVFFAEGPPSDGNVSYTYAPGPGRPESAQTGVGLLVTEFAPGVTPFLEKTVGAGAHIKRFRIDGDPAYFISGARHGVMYEDPDQTGYYEDQRLAGTTLLVERSDMLIRIEGELSRSRAALIAAAIPKPTP
jgi:hypothetical protein